MDTYFLVDPPFPCVAKMAAADCEMFTVFHTEVFDCFVYTVPSGYTS